MRALLLRIEFEIESHASLKLFFVSLSKSAFVCCYLQYFILLVDRATLFQRKRGKERERGGGGEGGGEKKIMVGRDRKINVKK